MSDYWAKYLRFWNTYLGGRCWEWFGRLCERRGGDTRYPGEQHGFKGGNSSHPANLNRGTAIPGPNVTLPLYLITCRLEVTINVMWKRGNFYNTSDLVSLLWVDSTPLKFVDEGQRTSSGWGKPQLYNLLPHLIIKMLKRLALTGALWCSQSQEICASQLFDSKNKVV